MQKQQYELLDGADLRRAVNFVWDRYFSKNAKTAHIRMAKNSYDSFNSPFTISDLAVLKFWMFAWKSNAFDEILGFSTERLQILDQDLYREITSYTWSEMNDATRDSLESDYGFVGNQLFKSDDGGKDIPVRRCDVALKLIADSIERKPLEIVSKRMFQDHFKTNTFKSKRVTWAKRVELMRKASETPSPAPAPPPPAPPAAVVGVLQTPTPAAQIDATMLAQAAVSAASSAIANGVSGDVSVAVTFAQASFTRSVAPPPTPTATPTPTPPQPRTPTPTPAPAPPPTPVATVATVATPPPPTVVNTLFATVDDVEPDGVAEIDADILMNEFTKTGVWSKTGVDKDKPEATRITIDGFRFYAKYRNGVSAKTKGGRDSYCIIEPNSRAERIAKAAGIRLKTITDRRIRSNADMKRFWKKISDSEIDIATIY